MGTCGQGGRPMTSFQHAEKWKKWKSMMYSSHCVCVNVAHEINVDDNESSFRREREVIVNEECIVWTNLWSSDCVQLTSLYLFTICILMEIGAFNRHIIVYNVFKSWIHLLKHECTVNISWTDWSLYKILFCEELSFSLTTNSSF